MIQKITVLLIAFVLFSCSSEDNSISPVDNETEAQEEFPVAVDDIFYGENNKSITITTLLENDTIFDYGRVSSIDNSSTEGGTIFSQGNNTYIYTPASNFIGEDKFNYTLCDANIPANCSEGVVTIIVAEDVATFKAVDDHVFIEEGTSSFLIENLLDNDFLSVSDVIDSINTEDTTGQVVLNNDGTVTYTLTSGFTGSDSFEYTICSASETSNCETAIVYITVATSVSFSIPVDIEGYYQGITFVGDTNLMYEALSDLVSSTHTTELSYTPNVWNTLQVSDLDPTNSENILLIYGYDENDSDLNNDRSRDKDNTDSSGSGSTNNWNREHVYPRSLGNPNLEFEGPGADAHNLRPCDPGTNTSRSNKRFADGSGISSYTTSGGYWYPGDEWIGDVARMMMYMYLRYEDQCLPRSVGVGSVLTTDANMVDLFLQWNAEDPVSDFEIQRNTVISGAQGNRNPFIDNPYLATLIWGGTAAENTWE